MTLLQDADKRVNGHLVAVENSTGYEGDDGNPLTPLQYIGRHLKADILSVTKIGLTACRWDITAIHRRGDERTVSVATAALQSRVKMKAAIFEVTGRSIPASVTKDIWEQIVQAIEDAAEEIDHGGSELQLWTERIGAYLEEGHAGSGVDITAGQSKAPIIESHFGAFFDTDGRLWINAESFHHWLRINRKIYLEVDAVRTGLAAIRFTSQRFSARARGHRPDDTEKKTRHLFYWGAPGTFDPGNEAVTA